MTIPEIDPQLVKDLVIPGLVGAAGGGGLAGYLASQDARPDEAPGERRRRIMRNALMGTALGGVTGAALPQGIKMVSGPFREGGRSPGMFSRGVDSLTDFGINHAAGLGTLAVGGLGVRHLVRSNRTNALRRIAQMVKGEKALAHRITPGELTPDVLHSFLTASPGNRSKVLNVVDSALSHGKQRGMGFAANELMAEAGSRGFPFNRSTQFLDNDYDLLRTKPVPSRVARGLEEHLGQPGRGFMANQVSRIAGGTSPLLGDAGRRMTRGISDIMPAWVPEHIAQRIAGIPSTRGYDIGRMFSEVFRPSLRGSEGLSQFSPTTMTAGTLAGAGAADELQSRLMGN